MFEKYALYWNNLFLSLVLMFYIVFMPTQVIRPQPDQENKKFFQQKYNKIILLTIDKRNKR